MPHVLGVDLAKESFVVAYFDTRGTRVGRTREFPNSEAGFRTLLSTLKSAKNTEVFFEATGCYGKLLAFSLYQEVRGLYELNPQIVKRLRSTVVQTKTDPADAVAIGKVALLLRKSDSETLERYRLEVNDDHENLRLWISEHFRLTRAISKLKAQIKTARALPCSDAASVIERREQELAFLADSKKRVGSMIEEKICADGVNEDADLLRSIPGIGPITAAALIAAIRTIRRFHSADALKAYVGVYPRRNQTGAREGRSRLAKHGNKALRHSLWNAARSAARHNPTCCALFEKLVAANKSEPSAYGAVCRKLIQICYGVLVNRTPFCAETA